MTTPVPLCDHSPNHNQLLAALPAEDYQRLLPDLELVRMPLGWAANEAEIKTKYVYFPTTCVVSKLLTLQDGASSVIAFVGKEGIVGISVIMGEGRTPLSAIVQCAGYAYRMTETAIKNEFSRGSILKALVLRHTQALTEQMGQTVACNRFHSVAQRLCRLLLLATERLPSNQLYMTQENISIMLGVRREGVTQAAAQLQVAGIIKYRRGHMSILDRHALEEQGCECYANLKKESDRLVSYTPVCLKNRPLWTESAHQSGAGIL